jgi:hypothetical protein
MPEAATAFCLKGAARLYCSAARSTAAIRAYRDATCACQRRPMAGRVSLSDMVRPLRSRATSVRLQPARGARHVTGSNADCVGGLRTRQLRSAATND